MNKVYIFDTNIIKTIFYFKLNATFQSEQNSAVIRYGIWTTFSGDQGDQRSTADLLVKSCHLILQDSLVLGHLLNIDLLYHRCLQKIIKHFQQKLDDISFKMTQSWCVSSHFSKNEGTSFFGHPVFPKSKIRRNTRKKLMSQKSMSQ